MKNEERNSYVKRQITKAFFQLLDQQPLHTIKISEITQQAQVSRNSFYRNYTDKEDIVRQFLQRIMDTYKEEIQNMSNPSNAILYQILFQYIQKNKTEFLILLKRDLLYIFQESLLDFYGPHSNMDNLSAYGLSFIMYGTYGWIHEWLQRGMQEDPETIATILANHK